MNELFGHQREAVERFKDEREIALFFEQGCGKSATALRIAATSMPRERLSRCWS